MTNLSFVPPSEWQRLKNLDLSAWQKTAIFAHACRLNTLYMITKAGSGHIGSSFSSLDLVSWLFLEQLKPEDIYFSSKGHDVPGLYAVLIALEILPFEKLHQLRRLGGLPGHPDISTPGIAANTGSLGMGIAKAKGMIQARRLQGKSGQIYVLTGDGELQEGQFWESLQYAANHQLGEITVIIDHNKIQSDTWVSKVSDLGDLEGKLKAFGWYVARCDGHDFAAIANCLDTFDTIPHQPKILIADTIKGKGVSFMEAMAPDQRLYPFHSGAPAPDIYTRAATELITNINELLAAAGAQPLQLETVPHHPPTPNPQLQRLIPAYSQALLTQAQNHPELVVLDADLALDCGLIPFEEKYPERFFECGIAEQDQVSQAGGMALEGLLPIVHSFACFLSTRPNEQIYNNATEKTKVIYVASLAGLLPSGPGHSHQSVRDISCLAAVPNLIMVEPSCAAEVGLALDYCVNHHPYSSYIRLVSIPCEIPYQLPTDYQMTLGRGIALTSGTDGVLFSYGPVLLPQAYQASQILAAETGLSLKVVNLPWLNRLDLDWLKAMVEGIPWVFSLDNHYLIGGQGDRIASGLAQLGLLSRLQYQPLGIADLPLCGQNAKVLQAHGLDSTSLANLIRDTLR